MCALLRCITECITRADRQSTAVGNAEALKLADAGYAFTLVQQLWHLDVEHPIWKEAAVASFYYFRWEQEAEPDKAGRYALHLRRTAEDLDPNAKQYRKLLAKNPDIAPETFSGPRNAFWEAIYMPGMTRRQVVPSNAHAEAPPNDLVVQRAQPVEQQPSATQVALAAGAKECSYCGRVPGAHMGQRLSRCARCKQVRYCSKECQLNHWKAGHSKQCVKI